MLVAVAAVAAAGLLAASTLVLARWDRPPPLGAPDGAELRWSAALPPVRIPPSPAEVVAAGDRILVLTPRSLSGYDRRDGRLAWRHATTTATDSDVLVATADAVVTTALGGVARVDPRTGLVRWQAPAAVGGPVTRADIDPSTGTVLLEGQGVVALDVESGAVRWRWQEIGPSDVHDGWAYLGQLRHVLRVRADDGSRAAPGDRLPAAPPPVSLAETTGTPSWYAARVADDAVVADVAAVDGTVIALLDATGEVVAVDAATGVERWRSAGPYAWELGVVATGDGVVALVHRGGHRLSVLDVETGQRRWTAGDLESPVSLAFDGDLAVLRDADSIAGLHADTGEVRWSSDGASAGSAISGGDVLRLTAGGQLELLDARSGALTWRAYHPDGGPPTATAVVAADVAIGAAVGGPLAAYALDDGTARWLTEEVTWTGIAVRGGSDGSDGGADGVTTDGGGDVEGTVELVATTPTQVVAIDLTSGAARWTLPLQASRGSPVVTTATRAVFEEPQGVFAVDLLLGGFAWRYRPRGGGEVGGAVTDGTDVFVTATDGTLAALAATDGARTWLLDVGGTLSTAPALAGDLVLVRDDEGALRAFERGTGRAVWRAEVGAGGVASSPAVDGATAVVAVDGQLRGVAVRDGAVRWTTDVDPTPLTAPVAARDVAYVGTADGEVVAVDVADGRERWRLDVGAPIAAPPVLTEGAVLVLTTDGRLLLLG